MSLLATLEIVVFYVLAFGLRSFLQWFRTGKTGFVGLRAGASKLERVAVGLMVVALVASPIAPWIGAPLWTRGHELGLIVGALGIVLTLVAQVQMGVSWRIGVDANERTELVTAGIFAAVRNPIFSAMLLASFGVALAHPTALALALPALLLTALELQVRFVEEPYLKQVHGPRYLDWAARTGRFLPWVGRLQA